MKPTVSEISFLMKQESPVLIVGAARSGTSILYNRLQHHSSFKLSQPNQVQLSESFIFNHPQKACEPKYELAQRRNLGYMMADTAYYQQFLDSTKSIQKYHQQLEKLNLLQLFNEAQPLQRILFKTNLSRQLLWKLLRYDSLVHSFFYYAKLARGVKRLLEKTPAHIYRLTEIKATFPQAKLLFIYRHPLDVFTSYKQRLRQQEIELGTNHKELDWLRKSPEKFCVEYTGYIQIAQQELIANPSGFALVKYEDLTSNTKAILQRICQFLDEQYEETMITGESEPKNWRNPYLYKPLTTKTKNWQDYISNTEAKFIEDQLHQVMRQLDYFRYT